MNKNFNIQLFAETLNTTATMSKEMKTFYESSHRSGRAASGARPVCGLLPCAPERRQDH